MKFHPRFILCAILLTNKLNVISQPSNDPSFRNILSLAYTSEAKISPSGKHVMYKIRSVDWKNNCYNNEYWLSKDGGEPFQLTNSNGGAKNAKWSPNEKWIAFLCKKDMHIQIQVIRVEGGESFQLTRTNTNIVDFEWSPDSKKLAFIQSEGEKVNKMREKQFGKFFIEDTEPTNYQLMLVNLNTNFYYQQIIPRTNSDSVFNNAELLIDGKDYSVNKFRWSPDGYKIAYEHQPRRSLDKSNKLDISIFDLKNRTTHLIVRNPSNDHLIDWSPDGSNILYSSNLNDSISTYFANNKLFKISVDGLIKMQLASTFDEYISDVIWNTTGIYGLAWQRTKRYLVKIDPANGTFDLINNTFRIMWTYSLSTDGKKMAVAARNADGLSEIYIGDSLFNNLRKVTNVSHQIKNWPLPKSEIIQWKSEDGIPIEGVIYKPIDFNPNKKYPLFVVLHGGPVSISTPRPIPSTFYPVYHWIMKGALVLYPNYRGSVGYGANFRALNVRKLGIGDAQDVISGVNFLDSLGIINRNRLACMGWSQGGFISAFLATNSTMFQAISVGAGISDWVTYYVGTDLHTFTKQYLKATPWDDPKVYRETSPISAIKQAQTPTLIQHGEFDKRVPTANAYLLYQGLKDVGAKTKLIIYNDFGHSISRPKERLAAMQHNWDWFETYVWQKATITD